MFKNVDVECYRRKTLISFSSESSFPFKAFLSMTLIAYKLPGFSLLSAKRTWENAPLNVDVWEEKRISKHEQVSKQKPYDDFVIYQVKGAASCSLDIYIL